MVQSLSYLLLDIVVATIVLVALRRHLVVNRRVLLVLGLLLVMTAVFDNIMIASHLFTYEWARTLGLRIGYAPLEDFAYPIVGTFMVIALWEKHRADTTK